LLHVSVFDELVLICKMVWLMQKTPSFRIVDKFIELVKEITQFVGSIFLLLFLCLN
jgi:hypothetical protein